MFSGLSAFPLTPFHANDIDERVFCRLMDRLVAARVDSIGVLGSTGSYVYLSIEERQRIVRLAMERAGDVPVIVGIGALRTRDVLTLAEDAQRVGASGVLLAPVSYQALSCEEVFGLYEMVTQAISVPLVVYDNPGTTHFEFSDELHARIARLPNVVSIKIPAVPPDLADARTRIERLRAGVPSQVTIGVSGDASAVVGLIAGCRTWYSVIGGLFPETALAIVRAVQAGDLPEAVRMSERLEPLWALFRRFGSLRVTAAAAELLGLIGSPGLPLPLRSLEGEDRHRLAAVLESLQPS